MQNLYQEKFIPTVTDVDYNSDAKPSFLLNCFQIVAGKHSRLLNASHEVMKKKYNAYWVLSRISVEVVRYPKIYEEVLVETWPLPSKAAFCERNYSVKDASGKVIAIASSLWTVLDSEKHTLIPIKRIGLYAPEVFVEKTNTFKLDKLPVIDKTEAEKAYELEVRMTDLDRNIHVNNTKYADFMQNAFTTEDFRNNYISAFQINYLSETKEHEKIVVYKKKIDKDVYLIEGLNDSGKTSFSASVTFSEK